MYHCAARRFCGHARSGTLSPCLQAPFTNIVTDFPDGINDTPDGGFLFVAKARSGKQELLPAM